MAVFKRRCLFYLVEVTYNKSLVILLLVSITIVDGLINVDAANNKKEAMKGENYSVHWNMSNPKEIYRLELNKSKTIIKSDATANWISTEFFTVNKTSVSIKGFMEGDKMRCMMTIHNVSYADDASQFIIKVLYVTIEPFRKYEEKATFPLNVKGGPEFCGTKLPNEVNLINKKAEVEICGHPKPEVNFYIHESKRLPGACELTEGRLKKYKCKVELTDLKCGEKLNLKIRGYQNMKLNSSSILIANYTPIDLKFEKKSIDCYNLSWSVHPLAKPCVKEYQLVVNQIDKAPLNTTTKTSNYLICSKSIQSCKVRTLCKSNQESDWVTAAITVGIPQSKDNASFFKMFISATIMAIFVIISLIIGLVLKKKLYKRSSKKPSSLEGLTRRHEEEGPKAYPNHYEETMFFAKHLQPV